MADLGKAWHKPSHGTVTWVVAADGERALFFHNDGMNQGLEPIPELIERHHIPDTHEMVSDRAGQRTGGPDSAGSGATVQRNDPHEFREKRFIEHLARELNEAALAKRFDRLIIAAPPRALGNLRKALSKQAAELVAAEYDKDFTKSPAPDLAEHVKEHLLAESPRP
jgi:protein required for attachment to host cells